MIKFVLVTKKHSTGPWYIIDLYKTGPGADTALTMRNVLSDKRICYHTFNRLHELELTNERS